MTWITIFSVLTLVVGTPALVALIHLASKQRQAEAMEPLPASQPSA